MEYVYAALLLHKLGQPINAESLTKVVSAAGANVDDAKVKTLIASLNGVNIDSELANASVAVAAPAAGGASGPVGAKPEEKKEEEKPVESAAGLSALFG